MAGRTGFREMWADMMPGECWGVQSASPESLGQGCGFGSCAQTHCDSEMNGMHKKENKQEIEQRDLRNTLV